MWTDDVIYLSLLLACIGFGKVTRSLEGTNVRKWTSSLFGLTLLRWSGAKTRPRCAERDGSGADPMRAAEVAEATLAMVRTPRTGVVLELPGGAPVDPEAGQPLE